MKKQNSSGLSGITFGHMKVCDLRQSLADFESAISHIHYATHYSPKEWQKSINAMIAKKGKGCMVSYLRTINLTEVDFNFNNKIMARDVLRCAEENELLPKEQYGRRSGHIASY